MSGAHPRRPSPRARPSAPRRCLPPAPGRPRLGAPCPTSRPRRRSPRPARPLRPAPRSSASLAPRRLLQDVAALAHCGIENGHAARFVRGWDLVRVDEGLAVDGVREVLHPVVADALGEPEGRRLLLGAPLPGQCARWLQVLAGGGGLRPHRRGHADPVLELVLLVRVWEVADAMSPNALGELHRLVPSAELLVSAAAGGAGAAGAARGAGAAGGAGPAGGAGAGVAVPGRSVG